MKLPLIAINGRFLTQAVTGVQRYAVEMVLELLRFPWRFRFVVVAPPGRLISEVPNLIQDKFPIGGHIWEQIRLPYLINKYKANLLWCPGNTGPIYNLGVPMVLTLHDAAPFAGPEWFSPSFKIFYHFIIPLVVRAASRIITVSKFSRQELLKYKIVRESENINVIYNGIVPLAAEGNWFDNKTEILQGKKYVFSVGSRDPRKNMSRLVLAWNNVREEIKNGRTLAIAGKAAKAFAKEKFPNIPKDVVFLGYIPDDLLFSWYKRADAFVFPSLYEGFGLPAIEAMSCSTPVLVSNKGSLPEICGDAALYCNPYNVTDIADKLSQLLTDKILVEELRKRGIERAKLFSWGKSAKQIIDIFEDVLRNH